MVTGKLGAAQLGGPFGRRCVGPASTRGRLDGMAAEDVAIRKWNYSRRSSGSRDKLPDRDVDDEVVMVYGVVVVMWR